ncbi:MAG: TetR/AcrR family transcriptional regulator [Brevundimonas sp.]|jgi:AcrR family transcriptional regulator|uniref:TetR/AcrR family transcriptional regulator n=1 Tax=Brevundimonas sp. TaxID=1871086 RepID=UPI0022CBB79C|nr:helix-turn-helix domain containing protein [Brevundimonas sp.]
MSSENGNRPDTRQPTTRDALLAAAAKAFNEHGFSGTDTNRIAREAGFAPQTFYRHFTDKTDIFIRVYELWQEDERARIAAAMRCAGDAAAQLDAVARTLIAAHRNHAGFRRSLRLLSVEDPRVRAARAASRRAQLEMIRPLSATLDWPARLAALLTVERLCDAAADREIADLGIDDENWVAVVAAAVAALRGAARP